MCIRYPVQNIILQICQMLLVQHDIWCLVCLCECSKKPHTALQWKSNVCHCNSIHTWNNTLWKQTIKSKQLRCMSTQRTTHQSSCELSETGSSTFTIQSIIMSQGQLQHQASQKPIKKCLSYLWRLHVCSHLLSVCVQAPHPPPRLFSHAGPTILLFSLGYGRWRIQGPALTRALRSWNCVIWN